MDQAERLRSLIDKLKSPVLEISQTMRVISVTSGKGGVGKSNFSVNLAIYLARANKRVIVIDADFGLANVEVLLGVSPKYSFRDVLTGRATIAEALATGPEGIQFLSGGSGLTQLADVTESQLSVLLSGFKQLEEMADILLIDTGAGISKSVINFLKASHEIIVVTTGDPTSITDAYTVMKAISEDYDDAMGPPQLKIVINRVENSKEGQEVFQRLHRVCGRFLKLNPANLGYIPYDKYLVRAVKSQEPVSLMYPASESSRSIEAISRRLLDEPEVSTIGIKRFVDRWLGFMTR